MIPGILSISFAIGCGGPSGQKNSTQTNVTSAHEAGRNTEPGRFSNAAVKEPADPGALCRPSPILIPAGTRVRIRLGETLSTAQNRPGDHFTATLANPIVVNGSTVVPAGAPFRGHVANASSSGRLKGRASLTITLDSFDLRGATHEISTTANTRVSTAHKQRNLALIGGGAGLGAVLGALAGGGKGALIGAGAGAAAGTAGAAATGKRNVSLPVESLLTFSFKAPVAVRP
jgi:outer membrane lipoprotein SlyB